MNDDAGRLKTKKMVAVKDNTMVMTIMMSYYFMGATGAPLLQLLCPDKGQQRPFFHLTDFTVRLSVKNPVVTALCTAAPTNTYTGGLLFIILLCL